MNKLSTIGRILFAIPFAIFGINHFLFIDFYTGMLTSFIPFGSFTIILTGIGLILACISIIIKKYIQLSTILLAILLLLFISTIHIPNLFVEANSKIAIIALLKDISLMGGALIVAGLYSSSEKIEA